MRKARSIALTTGATAVTAAVIAAMTAAAPAATATPTHPATPYISLKPGIHQIPGAAGQTSPTTTAQCEQLLGIACYQPSQVRATYNEGPLLKAGITGKGRTIVIVDAFGSPTIKSDLAVYDTAFHIPAPPKFDIIQPVGAVKTEDPGWAGETTLDVEWAHTIAPGANILLVETPVAETEGVTGFPQIVAAEEYVIKHHLGDVISQSFGATEETFTNFSQLAPLRAAYIDAAKHHITVLASTGDSGAANVGLDGSTFFSKPTIGWPASDPLVTAVGGTQIRESATGKFSQVVWNDTFDTNLLQAFTGGTTPVPFSTGGGKSEFFNRPSYQDQVAGVTGNHRGIPDISLSAACDGAVDFYHSYPGQTAGWDIVCGTSEASPLFSGFVALAAQVAGHSLGLINPRLYQMLDNHARGLVDVTSGNNTVQFTQGNPPVATTVTGYNAKKGYDLASGVGTINATFFVPELAGSDR